MSPGGGGTHLAKLYPVGAIFVSVHQVPEWHRAPALADGAEDLLEAAVLIHPQGLGLHGAKRWRPKNLGQRTALDFSSLLRVAA